MKRRKSAAKLSLGLADLLHAACASVMERETLRLNAELEIAELRRRWRLRCRCYEEDDEDE